MISSINSYITSNNLSSTNFTSNYNIMTSKSHVVKNFNEQNDPWLTKWFNEFIKLYKDKLFNLFNPTKCFFKNKNIKIGSLTLSFPQKNKMSIDYLEVDSTLRKRPKESAAALIEIVKYLLEEGKKRSIDKMTCLPMDDKQVKLYRKFGFKQDTNDYLGTSFSNFKKKADLILKKLSSNLKSAQK